MSHFKFNATTSTKVLGTGITPLTIKETYISTVAPSVTVDCVSSGGINYKIGYVTNNDDVLVDITFTAGGNQYAYGVYPGQSVQFTYESGFSTPSSYSVSARAIAAGKTNSSTTYDSGTISLCFAST